jgi:internalin A
LLAVLTFGLLVSCVPLGWAVEPNDEQAKAVAEIQKLGGKVTMDEKNPDKPITSVYLAKSKVSDAGLERLERLTRLQSLILSNTNVTDTGLVHLKGLTQLQTLHLSGTKITDAGLVNIQGLANLQNLFMLRTQVTDEGVKKLQQALPNCRIYIDKKS